MNYYTEPEKRLPVKQFDVVVAGGGTAGAVAAIAAARQGMRTVLIEAKGYPGGTIVEGGTALHSYFNLWKAFPGVEKRQIVKGIPQEIIERLWERGGTPGHVESEKAFDQDSAVTVIDTELYKLIVFEMLQEAGVYICVNTLLVGAVMDDSQVQGVIVESRSGREAFFAKSFVDCTAYADLCAHAGAEYTEPNDYGVCNSMGVGGVSVEKYYDFIMEHDALRDLAKGRRSGKPDQIIRLDGLRNKLPEEFVYEAKKIGMAPVITTTHDDYFMFLKINFKMRISPTDRDAVAEAELELRKRQEKAIQLFRKYVPGCEQAFMARTSPSLLIRRGRVVVCDYDITHEDVLEARHFEDDIMAYGFHDFAPRFQVKNGGSYGIPYSALRVKGIDNLLCAGMMITSDHNAHMSTRNTVSCMGQGQGAGTAAALCARHDYTTRELPYPLLRETLLKDGVHLEN